MGRAAARPFHLERVGRVALSTVALCTPWQRNIRRSTPDQERHPHGQGDGRIRPGLTGDWPSIARPLSFGTLRSWESCRSGDRLFDPAPEVCKVSPLGDRKCIGRNLCGRLVGENDDCEIANSYATGSVAGTLAGGLIGKNYYSSGVGISRSYSAGQLRGQQCAGGLVAYDNYEGSLKRTYWNTTTSGVANQAQGAGNINNDPGIKGLDNAKFTARLPRGLRSRIWAEAPSINAGLPYLVANPPAH